MAKKDKSKGTKARRHEGTEGEQRGTEGKTALPAPQALKHRMLPEGEAPGVAAPPPGPAPPRDTPGEEKHWSACSGCGASRLSRHKVTPVCSHTGPRVEGGIWYYMRCRECGKKYKTIRPD